MLIRIFKLIDVQIAKAFSGKLSRTLTWCALILVSLIVFRSPILNYAPIALALDLIFVVWPIWVSGSILKILARIETELTESSTEPYWALAITYSFITLVLIGIPEFYLGIIPFLMSTKTFAHAYWMVLKDWYFVIRVFDFHSLGHAVTKKELLSYLVSQGSKTTTWQWLLFTSHLFVIPILASSTYLKSEARKIADERRARELKFQREAEARRQATNLESENEIRHRVEKQRLLKIKAEEDRLLEICKREDARVAEIRRREEELEKKRQAKIQEVTGKNPWDSGFL